MSLLSFAVVVATVVVLSFFRSDMRKAERDWCLHHELHSSCTGGYGYAFAFESNRITSPNPTQGKDRVMLHSKWQRFVWRWLPPKCIFLKSILHCIMVNVFGRDTKHCCSMLICGCITSEFLCDGPIFCVASPSLYLSYLWLDFLLWWSNFMTNFYVILLQTILIIRDWVSRINLQDLGCLSCILINRNTVSFYFISYWGVKKCNGNTIMWIFNKTESCFRYIFSSPPLL